MKLSEEMRHEALWGVEQQLYREKYCKWADRVAALEQELAKEKKLHLGTAETHILIEKNLERQRNEAREELAKAQEHDKINIDFIRQYQDEVYQLRQAVKQFVDEMDAQFPKLEMLPGEYDTLVELIGGNDEF